MSFWQLSDMSGFTVLTGFIQELKLLINITESDFIRLH